MIGTILLVVIVGIVAAIVGAFLAVKMQRSYLNLSSRENQQNALERNQQNSRREWETRQERRIEELETNVTVWVEELRQALQDSEAQHHEQMRELSQQFETLQRHTHVEQVLDNLPRVEDTPLEKDGLIFPDWHPPILHDVDLSGRDLSYRYLRQADLRNAQLVKTNFFMADLSGAFLSGANLSGADLIGANLSGADLRNAMARIYR
jgi:TolA-binding protein